ncbi:hypothetical protein CLV42_104180 [Chitinophaga ginsengisoli]|uniref:Uncharacterized protein n=1 Tax=Chitinophaga ginsengisoli TaxID=363837 RepID=A0A2P8GD43_9BACT|nr:hypothetical protein CLV42_104180 [Chitinophaga ginsengisoli]
MLFWNKTSAETVFFSVEHGNHVMLISRNLKFLTFALCSTIINTR